MVLRVVGCVMVAICVVEAVNVTHEITVEARSRRWESVSDAAMPLDAAIDLRKAKANPLTEEQYLLRATAKDAWNTSAWIELSMDAEERGDAAGAGHFLDEAVEHDAGSAALWANANFYFRQGNRDEFFKWANRYRDRTHENEEGLFRIAAAITPNASETMAGFPGLACDELGSMLNTFAASEEDSDEVVTRMTNDCHDSSTHRILTQRVSSLLASDQPTVADRLWRKMGEVGEIANPDFHAPITGEGFDWRINQNNVVQFQQTEKEGVRFDFTDPVPSGTVLLFQPVSLSAGAAYRLVMNFDSDPQAVEAFRWELVEVSTGRHLASGLDTDNINQLPVWKFEAPATPRTVALALFYARPSGETPFQGNLNVHAVQLARQLKPLVAATSARR